MSSSSSSSSSTFTIGDSVFVNPDPSGISKSIIKDMLRSGRGKGKGGKSFNGLKPIRIKLMSTEFTVTSAASAVLANVSNVTLSTGNFPELSQFMLVFDELRMCHTKVHYHHLITTPGAAPTTAAAALNIQFDPTAAAPASISSAMEESYNTGPLRLFPGVNGATLQSGDISHKYHSIVAKVPKLAPITGGDCPGSAWIALDTATAPSMLVVGNYVTALGAGGVVTISFFVELDVELRLRT